MEDQRPEQSNDSTDVTLLLAREGDEVDLLELDEAIQVSARKIDSDWAMAKAWLNRALMVS